MTSYTPKAIAMSKAGIIKLTMWGSERIVSDEEYSTYWVLPLGTKETNDLVFETIMYSQMK